MTSCTWRSDASDLARPLTSHEASSRAVVVVAEELAARVHRAATSKAAVGEETRRREVAATLDLRGVVAAELKPSLVHDGLLVKLRRISSRRVLY